jgi:hypothetical protein
MYGWIFYALAKQVSSKVEQVFSRDFLHIRIPSREGQALMEFVEEIRITKRSIWHSVSFTAKSFAFTGVVEDDPHARA